MLFFPLISTGIEYKEQGRTQVTEELVKHITSVRETHRVTGGQITGTNDFKGRDYRVGG